MTRARGAAVVALAAVVVVGTAGCTGSSPTHHRSSSRAPATTSVPPPTVVPGSVTPPAPTSASGNLPTVLLSKLGGATVPTTFILRDDTAGITESKFYLESPTRKFLSSARAAPFQTVIAVSAGANTIEVRQRTDDDRTRLDFDFIAVAGRPSPSASPSAVPKGASRAPAIPVPTATTTVSSSAQLARALAAATPGTVIHLADGEYTNDRGHRWRLARSGTASAPITLDGGRGAVLESDSPKGDYGLWITGSYWQVLGLTVRNASKGIVLDGSQHTRIDNVEVDSIGDEGVHFRSCSSGGVLQNSYVHDTGLAAPNFGEGVYVGSANSNWSKYHCQGGADKSQNNTIRGNTFRHIAAEGADLKEGTDSGTLQGNLFLDTGYSGENSADSAVDVKGNNWTIAGNVVGPPAGADSDAFQTHDVYDGYGTANVFRGNVVQGRWPGYGIGLYPAGSNVAYCTNVAPAAAKGLVGDNGQPGRCVN